MALVELSRGVCSSSECEVRVVLVELSRGAECEVRVVLVELRRGAGFRSERRLDGRESSMSLSMLLVKQGFEDKP